MKRIVFLCSGSGGNFHFIRTCIDRGHLPGAQVVKVFSDRHCGIIDWCRRNDFPAEIVDFDLRKQTVTLGEPLHEIRPDIVVTSIARIVAPELVRAFTMVNLHYSLLPAYANFLGTRQVSEAMKDGRKIIGCTTHDVSEITDAGPAIAQVAIPLMPTDKVVDKPMDCAFQSGAMALLATLTAKLHGTTSFSASTLKLSDRTALYNGPDFDFECLDSDIWQTVHDVIFTQGPTDDR